MDIFEVSAERANLVESFEAHPRALELLKEAVATSNGRWSFPGVLNDLTLNRKACLFITDGDELKAVAVLSVETYETGLRALRVHVATGEGMGEWADLLIGKIEEIAVDRACEMVEGLTRPGWERVMKKHGYEKSHVWLEKKI